MNNKDTRSNSPGTQDTEKHDDAEVKDLELSEATAAEVRGGGTRQDGSYINHNEVLTTSG